MFENNVNLKNVAVVQTVEKKIRIAYFDGESMFAIRDVLQCCGIKHPDKWITRRRSMGVNDDQIVLLGYPCLTNAGYRVISMYFADAEFVKDTLALMNCDPVTRSWLEHDVLTYKFKNDDFPVNTPERRRPVPENLKKESEDRQSSGGKMGTGDGGSMAQRIDSMIVELIEIKRMLCC